MADQHAAVNQQFQRESQSSLQLPAEQKDELAAELGNLAKNYLSQTSGIPQHLRQAYSPNSSSHISTGQAAIGADDVRDSYENEASQKTYGVALVRDRHYSINQVDTFGQAAEGTSAQIELSQEIMAQQNQRLLHSPFFHNKSFNSRVSENSRSSKKLGADNDKTLRNEQLPKPVKSFCVSQAKHGKKKICRHLRGSLRSLPKAQQRGALSSKFSFFSIETVQRYPSLASQKHVEVPKQSILPKVESQKHIGQHLSSSQPNLNLKQTPLLTDGAKSPIIGRYAAPGGLPPVASNEHLARYETFGSNSKNRSKNRDNDSVQQRTPHSNAEQAAGQSASALRQGGQSHKQFTQESTLSNQGPPRQGRSRQNGVNKGLNGGGSSMQRNLDLGAKGGSLDGAKENNRQLFRTMENEQVCKKTASHVDILHKSGYLRVSKFCVESSPSDGKGTSHGLRNQHPRIRHLNLASSNVLSIPMTPQDYHQALGHAGSLSDGRSTSQRDTHSRCSTSLPLVMRHCYANNQEKRRLVEANQAAWQENQSQAKGYRASRAYSSARSRRPTHLSPQSSSSAFDNPNSLKDVVEKRFNADVKTKNSNAPKKLQITRQEKVLEDPNEQHPQQWFNQPTQTLKGAETQRKSTTGSGVSILTKPLTGFPRTHFIHDKKQRLTLMKVQSPNLDGNGASSKSRMKAFSPSRTKLSEPKRYIGTFFKPQVSKNKSFQSTLNCNTARTVQETKKGGQTQFSRNSNLKQPTQSKTTILSPKISGSSTGLKSHKTMQALKISIFSRQSTQPVKKEAFKIAHAVPQTSQKKKLVIQQTIQSQTPLRGSLLPQSHLKIAQSLTIHNSIVSSIPNALLQGAAQKGNKNNLESSAFITSLSPSKQSKPASKAKNAKNGVLDCSGSDNQQQVYPPVRIVGFNSSSHPFNGIS